MLKLIKEILRPIYRFITDSNYREYYRLVSKYSRKPRYHFSEIKIRGYRLVTQDVLSVLFQFKELFLENSYFFKTLNPSPIIYDCGANVGLSCIYFKENFPNCRIKAYEADPDIYQLLEKNLMPLKDHTLELFNKAIWIDDKGVTFNKEGADGGSVVAETTRAIHVESLRLRHLLNDPIDLLKLDIEGAELEVLLDCDGNFQHVENIFFEYHDFRNRTQNLEKLLGLMARNGFRYFIQSPHLINSPFTRTIKGNFDLQLNVYCTRE